jgi:predicted nucleic acid-binding protein
VINNLLPFESEKVALVSKVEALEMENKILSKHVLEQKNTIIDLSVLEEDNIHLAKELNDSQNDITKLTEDLKHQCDVVAQLSPLQCKTETLTKEVHEKSVLIDRLIPLIDENNNLSVELQQTKERLSKLMSVDGIDRIINNNEQVSTPKKSARITSSTHSNNLIERVSAEIYEETIGKSEFIRPPTIGIRIRSIDKLAAGNHMIDICKEPSSLKIEDPISKVNHCFDFNHQVLDSSNNYDEVLVTLGNNAIRDIWTGSNHTLIAYGQSDSGKTFTMFGEKINSSSNSPVPNSHGNAFVETSLLLFICGTLLHMCKTYTAATTTWEITLSCVEIYNEKLRDLLLPETEPTQSLKVRENLKDNIKTSYVENLSTSKIKTLSGVQQSLNLILKNRKVDNTKTTYSSSRSHVLIFVELKKGNSVTKLTLVDLAGTTKTLPIGEQGNDSSIEARFIRKSLSVLSRCIQAYSSNQRKSNNKVVIPTRESLLTATISNIFNGSTNITLLATVSPILTNINETIATINFAQYLHNCWQTSSNKESI